MDILEIIEKKKVDKTLTKEEIEYFIENYTNGNITDYQAAALIMAICINGMTQEEILDLTMAMANSGDVLDLSDISENIVDKHSTGGVGDKITLIIAPIIAALGIPVAKMSGRGLGITGGTADKLESIPGYNINISIEEFKQNIKDIGISLITQTLNLAPADKKIYAIRDVCATVESIPLITASILSKKLAAGLDYLVMDLKCGNGAFMSDLSSARELANSITRVASLAGTPTTAILTDMNQVLGKTVGNALEMKEAVEYLLGQNQDKRLHTITLELCAQILIESKICTNKNKAINKIQNALNSGKALEKFAQMVSALGGPHDFIEKYQHYLPQTKIIKPVYAHKSGYVSAMQTRDIGMSIISLKGGRTHPEQRLDYATGFSDFCQIGDYVDNQTPLALIHAQTEEDYNRVAKELQQAISISEQKPIIASPIIEYIR